MIIDVALKHRSQDIDLPTVNVELANIINSKAEFTLAFAPLLYLVEQYMPHYPAGCRLYEYEPVFLNPHPSHKLIIVLHKDLAPKKMSIESSTF